MSETQSSNTISRRGILTAAVVGGAGLALGDAPAYAAQPGRPGPGRGNALRLTVLGTTDLHGNVYNWDYFKNAEYDDAAHNDIGIAKAATLIKAMRTERGADTCITLDAGDTIQGTPLAYYYAKIDPITNGPIHPMAAAMNAVGYDAAALGNHEFNYGLDILRTFERQLEHPLLGANAVDWSTGEPVFPPYLLKRINVPGAKPVAVGILGLVTPGVAIWDKAVVEGKIRFPGLVEQAKKYVPKMKAEGADVVLVSAHSGADTSSSYGDALPYPENAASLIAEQVPDIDAILVGHAHKEIPQRYVTNKATGRQVLLSEPSYWGMRVTVMDLNLVKERGQWRVDTATATLLNSNTAPEDPQVAAALRSQHQQVLDYVNGVIGTCTQAMSAATSRYEDTAAMDFINLVQAQSVKAALAGTQYADTPVLSIAAPFNKNAAIPAGEVTVRDVAGLYIYDNTLLGIAFTGAQVKAYLEKSAEYFKQVPGPGTYPADAVTNATTPTAPNGTPDYNYDIMGGLDAELTYDIDIAAPVGSRIKNLAYAGSPVTDAQQFVVAINNYRQSGGGSFPGVTTAPVVDNRQQEIRQLLIDWVTANKTIDPPSFFKQSWKLTAGGTPLTITG
ncbi:bifunctional metallophosphatase/5'-nucleotidase [Enemella evansiae]|uniref:bifunctional metallophosphatase/5'-nucleotidase n=1 Tax=Enemella evansiae TaxID=2016499 RepID=UPI000B96CC82|nr:5'-nucleotidase C-terminal domain-containing protein [Enemella evansiae]OYO02363.1 bifunctional metallophosphatase/5'-nucleotidase [Enemella evansiae]